MVVLSSCILLSASADDRSVNEIRIGATLSQSGHFATEVGPFRKLFEAWASSVNKGGGIELKQSGKKLPVRLFIYDDRSDEATAKRHYERMATVDKVHLFLGPYSSPLTLAVSSVAESRGIPFIAICANSPKIYSRGYKWTVGILDLGSRYTNRYWDMISRETDAKSVSFVVEDTLHPVGVFEGAKKTAEEGSISVLSSDICPPDMLDFTTVLLKLREKNPDIMFVSSNIPFAINFLKQMQEFGFSPKAIHCTHHGGPFREALGETAENVVGNSYWIEGMKTGDAQFIRTLLTDSGVAEPIYPWAPAYIAAFQIAERSLQDAAGLDPASIMNSIRNLKLETVLGPAEFSENGYGTLNTYPSQIQGGKYVVVWPKEVAAGKFVYPRPPDK
jgi:branched-chain amino acid transport system substrate-binding protein